MTGYIMLKDKYKNKIVIPQNEIRQIELIINGVYSGLIPVYESGVLSFHNVGNYTKTKSIGDKNQLTLYLIIDDC